MNVINKGKNVDLFVNVSRVRTIEDKDIEIKLIIIHTDTANFYFPYWPLLVLSYLEQEKKICMQFDFKTK